jgi:DNA/RNA-binding domain of Phe-tRNA-synthetase-like protein
MVRVVMEQVAGLSTGLSIVESLAIGSSSEAVVQWVSAIEASCRSAGPNQGRFDAVRELLRRGGYRPAGRNKPAHEYLWRTFQSDGALPRILNAVDVLNAVSLQSCLPISLLATARVGETLRMRYGRANESFVFNRSGQSLDLEGLVVACSEHDVPLGTPVKDSMLGKLTEEDRQCIAVIYAPADVTSREELDRFVRLLDEGLSLCRDVAS